MTRNPVDVRTLARLISAVENDPAGHLAQMQAIEAAAGPHYCVGITGPPGAGKSTLTDQYVRALRLLGQRVAVIAIDPSSPFSGGAVLGDRIRMQAHAADPEVFIRSVGSRGARGGLSRATRAIVQIFAAHQFDWVIIETVGVGQSEFDIMELADTTVVVMVPEAGDTVQTLKAGLLEVADVFVVNKADRDGAAQMANGLTAMLQLGHSSKPSALEVAHHSASASRVLSGSSPENFQEKIVGGPPPPATRDDNCSQWTPPVLLTTATRGDGVAPLLAAVQAHREQSAHDPARVAQRVALRRQWCEELLAVELGARARTAIANDPALRAVCDAAAAGTKGLYAAVAELVAAFPVR